LGKFYYKNFVNTYFRVIDCAVDDVTIKVAAVANSWIVLGRNVSTSAASIALKNGPKARPV